MPPDEELSLTAGEWAARWGIGPRLATRFLRDFAAIGLAEQAPDGLWSPTEKALRDVGLALAEPVAFFAL
jgi:DNA-binding IclR family transcriptional regulator